MKSRLKKVAIMSPDMFQGQLDQISDQGRNILKSIEEYKFFVEQASRVVQNDQKLTELIINKKKNLDQAAQQIYDVVFEIENVDVIALYNEQQKAVEENKEEPQQPDTETLDPEENKENEESTEPKEPENSEGSEEQKDEEKDNAEKSQDDDKKEDK